MRISVRRYRRRRTGSDSLGFAQTHFNAPFFDRLIYLSQSISQSRKTDTPWIVLVTDDHFLRTGIQASPFPLNCCKDFNTLPPAMSALQQWPSARLVVDMACRTQPLTETLDSLRRLRLYPPYTPVNMLVRADDYDQRLFCKAAGPFTVIERQSPATLLQQVLTHDPPPLAPGSEWLSRDEWAILRLLMAGESLRTIARLQERPYSRIVYRVGRIVNKLGLAHRQALLHLLNRLCNE
ncbi:LuxR family transcriptional regulator [Leclercia adecarboxylata]|uniref:LuxR family transcriptional regulator n=1 Tax=Leclercia adecarboxylata TaxID=83655 RepID=UPI00202A4B8E|nr:LuxR family transcriptional regulator [Leclercia adecarboxylata]URO00274.1 LuxR family transcriptional regulator [Leclercia adecarboxylata]